MATTLPTLTSRLGPDPSTTARLQPLLTQAWAMLTRFHARARDEANRLPMEYWFWPD